MDRPAFGGSPPAAAGSDLGPQPGLRQCSRFSGDPQGSVTPPRIADSALRNAESAFQPPERRQETKLQYPWTIGYNGGWPSGDFWGQLTRR